jgi:cytochrome c553
MVAATLGWPFFYLRKKLTMFAVFKRLSVVGLLAAAAFSHAQDLEAGRATAAVCTACHGEDGNAVIPGYPSLAGQTWRYIYIQLKDYKEGRRSHPIMTAMASNLSRNDMVNVANYFARFPLKPNGFVADEAKVKLGKAKADETLCTMCHLGGFSGQNEIPRVAGQQYDYVVDQLRNFKARTRTNDAGNMTSVAQTLSDTDIENLGHYISSIR